jgi:hypothetical protein
MAEEKIIPEVENEELEDTTLEEAEVDEEALEETTDEGEEGEEGGEEETLYTQEQVENAVKTRVSTFNRKLEKMKGYETTVKKIGEITGMSPEALLTRLQGMSDAEQAKILGITPQQFALRRQATEATRAANENTMKLQRQLDEQKLLSDPKYKDYPLYKEEVLELMDDNPKLSIKQAYTLAKGDKGTQAAVRDAEQRAVAKMTKSSNQRVVKPGVTPGKTALKIDAATIAAAKKVGMDPAEYAAYSNISTLDDFERMKSSKKG